MSAENQWSRMLQHPGCKLSSTGTNHSSAMFLLSIHTHDTELNTQCFTPWEYWVSEQTFQRVSNRMNDTSYHYKLSNKHVTGVSTAAWNCLNELEWLEDSACLPWSLRTRMVSNHMMTEQSQSRNKEEWEETYLVDRRYLLTVVIRFDCPTITIPEYKNALYT